MSETDSIRAKESQMTKVRVKLRDPETVAGHNLDYLIHVWPYIPHEIHILAESLAIDRACLSCPIKGSRSWAGAEEDWQAAVASIPPSLLPEHPPGSFVCEHMIEIAD